MRKCASSPKACKARQQRLVLVEVAPAGLHHANVVVLQKEGNGAAQEVGRGHEVGVENGNELAVGALQAVAQGPGFVALPGGPAHVAQAAGPARRGRPRAPRQAHGGIGGVVEHLNVQQLGRVVEGGGGVDYPLHHVLLVVEGQLHRDAGPGSGLGGNRQGRGGVGAPGQARELPLPRAEAQNKQQAQAVHHHEQEGQQRHQGRRGEVKSMNKQDRGAAAHQYRKMVHKIL
jgi:hypothetical protein